MKKFEGVKKKEENGSDGNWPVESRVPRNINSHPPSKGMELYLMPEA